MENNGIFDDVFFLNTPTHPTGKRLNVFTLTRYSKCTLFVYRLRPLFRAHIAQGVPTPAPAPHRAQVGRLVSSTRTGHHRQIQTILPSTRRDRDAAGGGGAFAGEVPAGGGDHDGRRGAAAGVHDLSQQALAVLRRRRLRRRALFLLQADVGVLCLSSFPRFLLP